jgi:anti-sigma factor RsiW
MIEGAEPIVDADLDAYVDDQLDPARRVEVEAYLAIHPQDAARVMADLRSRDALRLLARGTAEPPAALVAAARRLGRAIVRRRMLRAAPVAAVALACLGIGWAAGSGTPLSLIAASHAAPAPRFVDEAAMAHRTALMRAAMRSQPEVTHLDLAEMYAATSIRLPTLPDGWRLLDVQLFPSDDGPSLLVTLDRGNGGPVSLFAVRARTAAPVRPSVTSRGTNAVAYWQEGETAMALIGDEAEAEIDREAEGLADETGG